MNDRAEIIDAIDAEWIAGQATRMIQIPSVTLDEQEICSYFEQEMRALGLDVNVREVSPGRNNLYARLPGSGDGPTLLLNGHLDTIPIGECSPCERDGDRIYGRGSTDMKGGMAAMLGAARALLGTGVELRGDVLLSAIVGHEQQTANKDGPLALIDDLNNGRIAADRILIVEGRDALWTMSMGSMVFTIELRSDEGGRHTQYVPFADNPIRYVGDLVRRIELRQQEMDAAEAHPLAGPERIDLGVVRSGDYFNRTPVLATLIGTLRWAPGKEAGEALQELRSLVSPIAQAGKLEFSVKMEHEREPFELDPNDEAVRAVARAHLAVTGQEAEQIGLRIVGDANLYVHGSGLPSFYYGPSNETAHADVEWISVERMSKAAAVYALAAIEFCNRPWPTA